MPNDLITIAAIARELDSAVKGGKIVKISQPEDDEILLSVRVAGKNLTLSISVEPNCPRVNLTYTKKDNPYACPNFCMHLRKHLTGATIDEVAIYNHDRILAFSLTARDELSISHSYTLFVELMGRYGNIILANEGIITECLRHIIPSDTQKRCLIPRQSYQPPENNRASVFDLVGMKEALQESEGMSALTLLKTKIGAMATVTYKETLCIAGIDKEASVTDDMATALANAVYSLATCVASPVCHIDARGIPSDYLISPYRSITEGTYIKFSTMSEAVEYYYQEKEAAIRIHEKTKDVSKSLATFRKRAEKLVTIIKQRIEDNSDYDALRLKGELLLSNIYRIKKGDAVAAVTNYYTGQAMEIPLEINKTPQQNAESYFRKFKKSKRTYEMSISQLSEAEANLRYLLDLEYSVHSIRSPKELEEQLGELEAMGIVKPKQKRQINTSKKALPLPITRYLYRDYRILVGRNNLQNELITFGKGESEDMWLHVKGASGSHTVIKKKENSGYSDEVILFAAEVAAHYSSLRENIKVEVDYTTRRKLSRHPNKKPGMVIYTDYKTICVSPNEHSEYYQNE